ncbi:uncharacterized protein LOC119188654 [Manduca sexta]|uniref:uncharacterized protein LOC119188654 n=1 Tax=Manduca sexta TaxID=7130 RepID=UPI00188F272F|nr:uncharacterized protein LOC119188654 [Manduca sexta]
MKTAINLCKAGESIKSTAKKYGLAYATLYRHVKTGITTPKLGRFRPVFNEDQEMELLTYLKDMDVVFFGLTRDEFKNLAFIYAKKNNLKYPKNWDKYEKAGDDWLSSFLSRHNQISLRTPEATSVARAKGFNRREVGRFYENLEALTAKHDIDASRLYNMDETGISTTTNKPPKVLSTKGKKQVGIIASAERGQLTTVIGCCNAAGSFLPPFLIFARKKMQPRLLDGAPPGTQGTCTPNGWTSGEVFLDWMRFFVEHVRPTPEKKILLLLDNHESHKYYPALDYASKNNIVILSLAPHTTHKMQPMDVAVYGPLKTYFEREVNAFQKSHPGRIINQYDVARLLSPAFLKCAVAINAVHGFKKPGIWPVNKYAFGDEDFEPADVIAGTSNMNIGTEGTSSPERIDIPGSLAETSSTPLPSLFQEFVPPNPVDPLVEIISPPNRATPSELEALVAPITDSFKTPEKITSEVGCTPPPEPEPGCALIVSAVEPDVAINAQKIDTTEMTETEENSQRNTSRDKSPDPEPGCSTSHYSPLLLRPIPNPAKPMTTRKRKLQKSEILTSTPIKEDQKQKFEKNKVKKVNKGLNDKSIKVPFKTVPKKTKTDKNKKKAKQPKKIKEFKDILCFFCGEIYIEEDDNPIEDWIRCDICQQWCHEECSAFDGTEGYICDNCQS